MHAEELRGRFGPPAWCATCSREVLPFDDRCPKCGSFTEELGTGDDDPYPEDASQEPEKREESP